MLNRQCLMNIKTCIIDLEITCLQLPTWNSKYFTDLHISCDVGPFGGSVLPCGTQPYRSTLGVISFVSFYHKTDQLSSLIFLCDFKRWSTDRIPHQGCFLLSPWWRPGAHMRLDNRFILFTIVALALNIMCGWHEWTHLFSNILFLSFWI